MSRRVALVTGAAGGIGRAVVERLLRAGFAVLATDLAGLEALQGPRLSTAPLDVTDPDAVAALAERVRTDPGRVDLLVNNAGVFARTPALRLDEAAVHRVLEVNLLGAMRCTAAFGVLMARQRPRGGLRGRIVNVASLSGLTGAAMGWAYAASKAGLIAATRSAARELAPSGIAVNAVAPGYIDTPMADRDRAMLERFTVPRIPVRRLGLPEDVAEAVLFLATCRTDYLTGSVLTLDGGLHVG